MQPGTQAVYGPNLKLLQALQAVQGQAITDTASQARTAFDTSVSDVAKSAQKLGMGLKDLTPEEYGRYFGANALPALSGVDAGVTNTKLQLADTVNKLLYSRGDTGYTYGDKEKQRQTESRIGTQKIKSEENQSIAQTNAEVQASRIMAARQAAEDAKRQAASNLKDVEDQISGTLETLRGPDQKVSPQNYRQALGIYQAHGGNPLDFHKKFGWAVNLQHSKDYYQ